MKEQEKKVTDPGAEMKAAREAELKAREFREHGEWQTTVPFDYAPAGESRWEDRYAAAFAAKEVARSEKVAMAIAVLLRAKCSDKEWEALPKELTYVADDALARAVEEERENCAKAICEHCKEGKRPLVYLEKRKRRYHHTAGTSGYYNCYANEIHERSQVKGEGL